MIANHRPMFGPAIPHAMPAITGRIVPGTTETIGGHVHKCSGVLEAESGEQLLIHGGVHLWRRTAACLDHAVTRKRLHPHSRNHRMNTDRRQVIFLLPGLAAAPAAQASGLKTPTPSQFAGPYYPVVPIPRHSDLTRHQGNAAEGVPLTLTGGVVDILGQPMPDVLVEIWQADHQGRYRHPKAPGTDRVDPGYAGFGATLTDGAGRYTFQTILPVPYTGRPPHIHARLHWKGREILTTQLYLAGQAQDRGTILSLMSRIWGDRQRLSMQPLASAAGRLQADFEFVVET